MTVGDPVPHMLHMPYTLHGEHHGRAGAGRTARACITAMLGLCVLMLGVIAWGGAQATAETQTDDAADAMPPWQHGLAMHGDMRYGPDFTTYDYVDPQAPKGGEFRQATTGGFDSLNPFIAKGRPAAGLGLIFDTLTVKSPEEPFTEYGLVAEAVRTPADRSWVEFRIDPDARFHDGTPITVADVIWTFETLRSKGAPLYRYYYAGVAEVSQTGPRTVRFGFVPGENRELPLILGQMIVLSKDWWADRDFGRGGLEPPLGSGPYRIGAFEPNRYIVYERDAEYWAKDHPVNRGRYNFDAISYDYYRDDTVLVEALKADEYDLRSEHSAGNWANAYNNADRDAGRLVLARYTDTTPKPMQALIFNMRRELFRDPLVRRALAAAFDFEWLNGAIFHDQYARSRSYFNDSDMAATGLPEGRELAILEPWRDQLPAEVFNREYRPPTSDGSGIPRTNLLEAQDLLKQAGWVIDPDSLKLVQGKTGRPFRFTILLRQPSMQRVMLPFARNLARLGIEAAVRIVDPSQYVERVRNRDFDMIVGGWAQSTSPGNEQRDFWTTAAADNPASRNYMGLKNPVVDALVEGLIAAPDRAELEAYSRALDRVLQWQHMVIPQYYAPYDRVIYWDRFGKPDSGGVTQMRGLDPMSWWYDPVRARALDGTAPTAAQPAAADGGGDADADG